MPEGTSIVIWLSQTASADWEARKREAAARESFMVQFLGV
jgi:hypothetical protein